MGYWHLENGASNLWSRYKKEVDKDSGDDPMNPDLQRTHRVLELVHWFVQDPDNQRPVGFDQAVQRLELLSPDLTMGGEAL